jgi:hypothetical protein
MGTPRRLAARLLEALVHLAPAGSRDWALAMLGELNFIEGEWASFFWAMGGATAILGHAALAPWAWLKRQAKEGIGMINTGKKIMGVSIGVFSALMLAGCLMATLRIAGILFPGLYREHSGWFDWLAVLAIPEAIFIFATVLLWRKRGPVAAGLLATGLVMALHIGVHLAMR